MNRRNFFRAGLAAPAATTLGLASPAGASPVPAAPERRPSLAAQRGFLPNVPLVMDLPTTPQNKAALKLIASRQSIARPFAAPPGIPADRLAALRTAFDATMKDPAFLAEAKRLDLEVRPVPGIEVEKLIKEIYATPPDVVKLAAQAEKSS